MMIPATVNLTGIDAVVVLDVQLRLRFKTCEPVVQPIFLQVLSAVLFDVLDLFGRTVLPRIRDS